MNSKDMQGEGNYDAAKAFNDAEKKFVESGKVEQAARDAEPQSEAEAEALARAEEVGRSHAKEKPVASETPPKRELGTEQPADPREQPLPR